jgi:hypothetical protein
MKPIKVIIAFLVFSGLVSLNYTSTDDHYARKSIDRSLGLFPHAVGNIWVKDKYGKCSGVYRMEIISALSTDTADFFQINHLKAACEDQKERSYNGWYAEDKNNRIYIVGNGYKYLCRYADFNLVPGDRFIRMGLMDYVVNKDTFSIKSEYDDYEAGISNSTTFEMGLGLNPQNWSSMRICDVVFRKELDY